MCSYSMVMQHGIDWMKKELYNPGWIPTTDQMKIEELERRIKDLEELLRKAKIYDEENDQKDCELDEKKKILQDLAKQLGVEINVP